MQRLAIFAVAATVIALIGFFNHNAYALDDTTTAVTPSPSSVNSGAHITFTVIVADYSTPINTPGGNVTWSDGSSGTFNPTFCTLSSGSCTTSYTPSANSPTSLTITANYAGDSAHSASFATSSLTVIHSTTTKVTPNPATLSSGSLACTVKVNDTSGSPTTPITTVAWSDGGLGGSFNPTSCTLSSGSCQTSYIASTNSPSSVTITANYAGDSTHSTSSGTSSLTVNQIHATTTTVTPNPSSVNSGSQITFTVTVSDSHLSPTTPTGNVTWSSGNAGGTFSRTSCPLSSASCTTAYTAATNSPSSVTITATYAGDSAHSGSAGISSLSVNVLHRTTTTIKPNPATLPNNGIITFVVKVNDSSGSPTTPLGTVSWKDGNTGGTFNATSCTLSSGACVSKYTASGNPPHVITINATYSGDATHMSSSAASQLSTNVFHGTTTTVTPSSATLTKGSSVVFTATVADTLNSSATLIGLVSWSDYNTGGTFTEGGCALAANHCSITYVPPTNPSGSITIVASYAGDSYHSGSSGVSSLSVATTPPPFTTPPPSSTPPPFTTPPPSTPPATGQNNSQGNTVPEFPVALIVLLTAFASLIAFYRIKPAKI